MISVERIGIIADDFTGAMDTGAQLLAYGEEVVVWLSSAPAARHPLIALSTDSREIRPESAAQRVRTAVAQLAGWRLYKKIDSTLRGNVGIEIQAALHASGLTKAVLCPAVIAGGRTVRDGRLFMNGLPLEQTPLASDPGWPAHSSQIADILQLDCLHISLEQVRGPLKALSDAIRAANTAVVIADAVLDSDLERIGAAAAGPDVLPCGALGLARSWAQAVMGGRQPGRAISTGVKPQVPLLVVCGSASPISVQLSQALAQQQGAALIEVSLPLANSEINRIVEGAAQTIRRAQPAILRPQADRAPALRSEIPLVLGELARQVIARARPGGLLLMGGETARQAIQALEASAIFIQHDLGPGLAAGHIADGLFPGLPVVTMSGSLGGPSAFQFLLGR